MAIIEIPDDWLESTGLSAEEAKDYLLTGYPVMKELLLREMGSTFILSPPSSVVGLGRVILRGIDGPVTEKQSEDLRAIIGAGEHTFEQLTLFRDVVSSVFGNHSIYLSDVDLKEAILSTVSYATKNREFEVEYDIPENSLTIQSDGILVGTLLSAVLKTANWIHPTNKGKISVSAQRTDSQIRIQVATGQDAEYPFELSSKNPRVFLAHSLAKELQGEFEIAQNDNAWKITILLPIKYVMNKPA